MNFVKLKNEGIVNVRFIVSVERCGMDLHFHLVEDKTIIVDFDSEDEAIEALEKFYLILKTMTNQ